MRSVFLQNLWLIRFINQKTKNYSKYRKRVATQIVKLYVDSVKHPETRVFLILLSYIETILKNGKK